MAVYSKLVKCWEEEREGVSMFLFMILRLVQLYRLCWSWSLFLMLPHSKCWHYRSVTFQLTKNIIGQSFFKRNVATQTKKEFTVPAILKSLLWYLMGVIEASAPFTSQTEILLDALHMPAVFPPSTSSHTQSNLHFHFLSSDLKIPGAW